VPGADRMFHLVAIVVVASMIAHTSTDALFARWFRTKMGDLERQAVT